MVDTKNQSNSNAAKQNTIVEAQQDLGVPNEPHYDRKTPLLKLTVGTITSNLSLTEKWDEDLGSYKAPVPTYSLYFEERVRNDEGRMERSFTMIPLPKNAAAFKQIGEHFLKLAKAAEGLELERSVNAVDDLDKALDALKVYKK